MIKYIDRLEYISHLIKLKATGSPDQLAKKLGVSKRTVYEYLRTLEELGANISYSYVSRTYFYCQPGDFSFRFKKQIKMIE
jgi:predicted DNA-binding transcriptional regulator YafY